MSEPILLTVPADLIEAIARRVVDLLRSHDRQLREVGSPWLDFQAACAYLGLSRNTLYKLTAAGAVPVRKKSGGQRLRFHRDELDAWMESAYPRLDRLPDQSYGQSCLSGETNHSPRRPDRE
jgi:excisionase family DNA binding protein